MKIAVASEKGMLPTMSERDRCSSSASRESRELAANLPLSVPAAGLRRPPRRRAPAGPRRCIMDRAKEHRHQAGDAGRDGSAGFPAGPSSKPPQHMASAEREKDDSGDPVSRCEHRTAWEEPAGGSCRVGIVWGHVGRARRERTARGLSAYSARDSRCRFRTDRRTASPRVTRAQASAMTTGMALSRRPRHSWASKPRRARWRSSAAPRRS